jgi:hypothetical protein
MISECSGSYRLHEALLSVMLGTTARAESVAFSRITAPLAAVSGTAAVAAAISVSSPARLTRAQQSNNDMTATSGINFLIFLQLRILVKGHQDRM